MLLSGKLLPEFAAGRLHAVPVVLFGLEKTEEIADLLLLIADGVVQAVRAEPELSELTEFLQHAQAGFPLPLQHALILLQTLF